MSRIKSNFYKMSCRHELMKLNFRLGQRNALYFSSQTHCSYHYQDFEETVPKTATIPEKKTHKLGRGGLISYGQMQGYRWLHLQKGYVVSQDTVRHLIKFFDPEGVELRRAHRLRG